MKELVQFIAQQLVNNPDAVEVKETQGETASMLELRVAKEDLGRVIGKQGRTVRSMRTILAAVGQGHHLRYELDVVEDEDEDDDVDDVDDTNVGGSESTTAG